MPIHDWTRVSSGIFQAFYQDWTIQAGAGGAPAGVAVSDPPLARQTARVETESAAYARKANRIVVRHELGQVVAVLEVVSPGNKDSANALRSFTAKAVEFLRSGTAVPWRYVGFPA